MAFVGTLLSLLIDGALGLWLGTICFFSFVAAPRTFAVLPRDRAGNVVNDIFPRYYRIGVVLGAVTVVVAVIGIARGGDSLARVGTVGGAGVGVALAAYSAWVLIPRMQAASEEGFARFHRQSVILNALTLLSVGAAFVASHVATWG